MFDAHLWTFFEDLTKIGAASSSIKRLLSGVLFHNLCPSAYSNHMGIHGVLRSAGRFAMDVIHTPLISNQANRTLPKNEFSAEWGVHYV